MPHPPRWAGFPVLVLVAAVQAAVLVPWRYLASEDGPTNIASLDIITHYSGAYRHYFTLDFFPKFDMLWQIVLSGRFARAADPHRRTTARGPARDRVAGRGLVRGGGSASRSRPRRVSFCSPSASATSSTPATTASASVPSSSSSRVGWWLRHRDGGGADRRPRRADRAHLPRPRRGRSDGGWSDRGRGGVVSLHRRSQARNAPARRPCLSDPSDGAPRGRLPRHRPERRRDEPLADLEARRRSHQPLGCHREHEHARDGVVGAARRIARGGVHQLPAARTPPGQSRPSTPGSLRSVAASLSSTWSLPTRSAMGADHPAVLLLVVFLFTVLMWIAVFLLPRRLLA